MTQEEAEKAYEAYEQLGGNVEFWGLGATTGRGRETAERLAKWLANPPEGGVQVRTRCGVVEHPNGKFVVGLIHQWHAKDGAAVGDAFNDNFPCPPFWEE